MEIQGVPNLGQKYSEISLLADRLAQTTALYRGLNTHLNGSFSSSVKRWVGSECDVCCDLGSISHTVGDLTDEYGTLMTSY
jgi:hypothetical protein